MKGKYNWDEQTNEPYDIIHCQTNSRWYLVFSLSFHLEQLPQQPPSDPNKISGWFRDSFEHDKQPV